MRQRGPQDATLEAGPRDDLAESISQFGHRTIVR
jgi:hypothetical protein